MSVRDFGVEKVDFVSEPGQYAIRGAVVDIFSYSDSNPYRISFFGDEVEAISGFNCNTQLSVSSLEKAEIHGNISAEDASEYTDMRSILPEDTLIWLDSSDMYRESEAFEMVRNYRKVFLDVPLNLRDSVDKIDFDIAPQPSFNKNFDLLISDIARRKEEGYRILIFGDKKSQLDRLKSILSHNGSALQPEMIYDHNIHNGFIDNQARICCYSDHEIFDRFHRVSIKRTVERSEMLTVNDLASFNIGDYIVHIDYGVGIFGGLVRMKDDKGRMHDVVKLMYKDNDVIFISVHSLHKISRFRSKDTESPRINKLGTKTWQNLKTSAKSKVKDIAKDLIKLYAARKNEKGFAFSPDSYLQQELESSFLYEDTPDQEKATTAVKRDMEDECPMDRLVCGDVGFGKTEVAIRAAFKAVAD
ncbi:MAG: transcription-repair coupling factor, partial [Bacteroidales bacterium]|nr:transcription-repair coupling factor [Bacteroidales bacterium]